MQVEKVLVVGGGLMGSGIAQVVARAGLDVTVVDISEPAVKAARARLESGLARLAKSGKATEDEVAGTRSRIAFTTDLEAAAAVTQHVIEAVPEELELKRKVFARLDAACPPEVVLATNTSQFSITAIAAATGRPDRVVGTHWFFPPPVMRLIEIVRGLETSDSTLDTVQELAARYGKETIVCRRDTPGFITSRLMMALSIEAARILEEGIADADDINRACVLGFNHAMGPLDTLDLSGLDTALHSADSLREEFGDRFLAPQTFRTLVTAGHLGRKTGRGFRNY
jgi:3-hydroxybutyryl-CoA dehydrogenase